MGRNTGSTKPQLYAVPAAALRPIEDADALAPGEVLVTVKARRKPAVSRLAPLPKPSDVAFEVWRLVTHKRQSYGKVAVKLCAHLAPTSRSDNPQAVRVALAKKYTKQVKDYLATPVGLALQASPAWRAWRGTGVDAKVLRIVPFNGYNPKADHATNYANFVLDRLPALKSHR